MKYGFHQNREPKDSPKKLGKNIIYFRQFVLSNTEVETTKLHSILNPSMILISALLNPQLESCFYNLDMETFYLKEYQVTDLQCGAQ